MKTLSLEEIEEMDEALSVCDWTSKATQQLLDTAREYHRLKEALNDIACNPDATNPTQGLFASRERAREALKEDAE